jgi:hypothetical protein
MTPWLLGLPLVVFAFTFAALVWIDNRERIQAAIDKAADLVRETLEDIGRLPFVILLALALVVPAAPARAGIRIDIPQLVEALLTSEFMNVGGSALQQVGPADRNHSAPAVVPVPVTAETHPTPVAGPQEGTLPPPPAPAMSQYETQALACIRKAEGGTYSSVSPSGKHRNAYQMDNDFWEDNGGDPALTGRHEQASVAEQDAVALEGFRDRGFGPWPPAKRACS